MISICVIFLLGNVPQIVVMILQNEAMETNFNFQVGALEGSDSKL